MWSSVARPLSRLRTAARQKLAFSHNWRFFYDVWLLIASHKWYSLAIILVTIAQEIAALWPVSLLGQFVDGLSTGDIGNVVWLLLGASLLYPAILRGNVILRHKMFYETDYAKRRELVLLEADSGEARDVEAASSVHTLVLNAVSGISNAAYHILGSFTPVIIKIVVVSGNLLAYNRLLGVVYLASLVVPVVMTVVFNRYMQVLRDTQYSTISRSSGAGVRVIADGTDTEARERFLSVIRQRTDTLIALVARGQTFIYVREAALVGSQFIVIAIALAMREQIGITPGDFTRIIGYTTQVAASFITTASCLDAIVSHSRAYTVYARAAATPPRPSCNRKLDAG